MLREAEWRRVRGTGVAWGQWHTRVRRELLPKVLVGLVVLVGVLFYVWQQVQVVRLGYEIERLRAEQVTLARGVRELKIAIARLRSLKRVEEVARKRLGMSSGLPGQLILIDRSQTARFNAGEG
ncbi:MAG: septum formation initiator family protein [Candidatus Methylomirabilales bacterium]